jgi:hypothetical protein
VPARPAAYYRVAGVDLRAELNRLRRLAVFAGGPLAGAEPELKVRRARERPNRVGFAIPAEFRLSVTDYPGIRPGDALETLLHELVHLHVGRAREARAWHGRAFKAALARAMEEAYGVRGVRPRNVLHGAYAEAIERAIRNRAEREPYGHGDVNRLGEQTEADQMLAMTQEAAEAVEAIVSRPDVPDSAVIRIAAGEGHGNGSGPERELHLELVARPHSNDLVVPDARIAVEPTSLPFLDDKILDVDLAKDSVEFRLYTQPDDMDTG